jgi:hypothetical protein
MIGNLQDITLPHVSDDTTNVTGSYDTEANVDCLYY